MEAAAAPQICLGWDKTHDTRKMMRSVHGRKERGKPETTGVLRHKMDEWEALERARLERCIDGRHAPAACGRTFGHSPRTGVRGGSHFPLRNALRSGGVSWDESDPVKNTTAQTISVAWRWRDK